MFFSILSIIWWDFSFLFVSFLVIRNQNHWIVISNRFYYWIMFLSWWNCLCCNNKSIQRISLRRAHWFNIYISKDSHVRKFSRTISIVFSCLTSHKYNIIWDRYLFWIEIEQDSIDLTEWKTKKDPLWMRNLRRKDGVDN